MRVKSNELGYHGSYVCEFFSESKKGKELRAKGVAAGSGTEVPKVSRLIPLSDYGKRSYTQKEVIGELEMVESFATAGKTRQIINKPASLEWKQAQKR
jgi:hypothetical protein